MERVIFPLERTKDNPLTLDEIKDALNSIAERLSDVETKSFGGDNPRPVSEFTAADRAVLDEVASFLGVHSAVATAVAEKTAGDTETARVVVQKPTFGNQDVVGNGA
jgi:hypothetical protein